MYTLLRFEENGLLQCDDKKQLKSIFEYIAATC
jgi:hypothetical protein